jgi:hypothetical protein
MCAGLASTARTRPPEHATPASSKPRSPPSPHAYNLPLAAIPLVPEVPAWWWRTAALRGALHRDPAPVSIQPPCPCARPNPRIAHGLLPSLSPSPRRRPEALLLELYQTCSRTSRSVATIQGARRASGQTHLRAASTKRTTDLCACSVARPRLSGFIHQSARSESQLIWLPHIGGRPSRGWCAGTLISGTESGTSNVASIVGSS